MANNSGLTYLSGLLRAGAAPVGAGDRAARRRVAVPPRANTSPHASPSALPAPADHADAVLHSLDTDAAERAAHTSASATLREDAAESTAPVIPGALPVHGVAARHEQPARVFHAPPQEESPRRGVSDLARAVESDTARAGESARGVTDPTPHRLEAHINRLRALMQTRGAEASHAEGEGAAGRTSRAAIASPRAAVGAMQIEPIHVAKQAQPAHAPASRTRESQQEGNAARMASPAHTPKLTINRLDVQVVNRADPQPPARPAPPASPSQPDPWGAPDRSFLGRFC
jgi:hypothetical protein